MDRPHFGRSRKKKISKKLSRPQLGNPKDLAWALILKHPLEDWIVRREQVERAGETCPPINACHYAMAICRQMEKDGGEAPRRVWGGASGITIELVKTLGRGVEERRLMAIEPNLSILATTYRNGALVSQNGFSPPETIAIEKTPEAVMELNSK